MDLSPKLNQYFDKGLETMDWEARKGHLNQNFKTIFRHAFEKAGAYREFVTTAGIDPSQIRGIEDIEKLPILRMTDLVEWQKASPPFGELNTVDQEQISRIYVNPGLIWQPGSHESEDTSWAEALCGTGFQRGDILINTFNYHQGLLAFMLDKNAMRIGATVVPMGGGNTLMQVKTMRMLEVTGFLGTPSFLMTLAQRAESMGLDPGRDFRLRAALVGAEMLPESLRYSIEKKFDITVNQTYGTVFLGTIGYECPFRNGLHTPLNMVVEIVDPKTGKQVAPGAAGEVVATSFNKTYPMIRMATGDLSVFSMEACPCGRTGPLIKKILGRIDQAAKVHGTFIHPWQIDEVVSRFPEIYKYQVVITREDHQDMMTFQVELRGEVPNQEIIKIRLERDIKDFLTIKGVVRIVPLGTLPELHQKIDDQRKWE
jgi:phenylacetate-CoA ligase